MGLISFRVLVEGLSFRSGPAELNEYPLNLSATSLQLPGAINQPLVD